MTKVTIGIFPITAIRYSLVVVCRKCLLENNQEVGYVTFKQLNVRYKLVVGRPLYTGQARYLTTFRYPVFSTYTWMSDQALGLILSCH
jgi:hypothetical protein